MITRSSKAFWEGTLAHGQGRLQTASGTFDHPYSFASRFEQGKGTNPEELIGAAHAGCFSMALAHILTENGYPPGNIETEAEVSLDRDSQGFHITAIELNCQGTVENIDEPTFVKFAGEAKANCPVSRALAGVDIRLKAMLLT